MFLIDAIKPKVEKKLKPCLIFCVTVLERWVGSVQNKTSFVSFHFRFAGGNKNFIQKKQDRPLWKDFNESYTYSY